MTYAEAIQFLYGLQLFGTKPGLENSLRLAALTGNPQNQLRFIHVAGTNGKGSTCAMLESIYRIARLRVGLYTSPHLVSFRERIQVNRELISEADLVRLVSEAKAWLEKFPEGTHATLFEVVTVIALRYFAEQKCDVVVWETGLGGRLDATNIVTPLASVITNVQFDHEKWLGGTLEEIAREKAGIIKPRVPIITAAIGAPLKVIRETAERLKAPLRVVGESDLRQNVGLPGEHQRLNAAVAAGTVETLSGVFDVTEEGIRNGLATVNWPARFQVIGWGTQTIILDGAHNPAGAAALAETLRSQFKGAPLAFVVGMLEDKDWPAITNTFAAIAHSLVCVPVASQRTALPGTLAHAALQANPGLIVRSAASLAEALSLVQAESHVVITGSLYLVGEAMELLGLSPGSNERALNEWAATRR